MNFYFIFQWNIGLPSIAYLKHLYRFWQLQNFDSKLKIIIQNYDYVQKGMPVAAWSCYRFHLIYTAAYTRRYNPIIPNISLFFPTILFGLLGRWDCAVHVFVYLDIGATRTHLWCFLCRTYYTPTDNMMSRTLGAPHQGTVIRMRERGTGNGAFLAVK